MKTIMLFCAILASMAHGDSLFLKAHSVDTPAASPSPDGIQYNQGAYDSNWQNEYGHGKFPSFKDLHPQAWKDLKVEAVGDTQSDGKPSPGLTGKNVGAYLKTPLPPA